jgi:mRNA-degrading endonuclease toxin of MazEF toxin-antitoxin module
VKIARGDVVWASLDPTVGREQAKHRPHLVLSDDVQHRAMRLVIVVPMTSVQRPWPTRIELAPGSYAICEQVRTLAVERITKVEQKGYDVAPVRAIVNRLIGG